MKQKLKKTGTFFARIFKQTLATLPDSFIILIFLITFWRAEKSNSTDLLEQSFNMFYTILAKGILSNPAEYHVHRSDAPHGRG